MEKLTDAQRASEFMTVLSMHLSGSAREVSSHRAQDYLTALSYLARSLARTLEDTTVDDEGE